ncbi:MAG TPA: thiamine pyrophosphate-binding protein [Thermoanaerobaculia bacterium]|nr:thiamine pyrophosphate-binding protein [Thermoanaerobaculia bacterium]HQN08030.1 thiamine pyrophosphate-binding protein [Thermoanaerobaculia bacterium]HQP87173.1 thiamine pyrophosphate-binding protein [Thermoanaerobaculia bacterium]
MTSVSDPVPAPWQEEVFSALKGAGVRQVAWVPDAGHAHVIDRVLADPGLLGIPLTTEEEGVALACGAALGGDRAVLLMQSSGVGNCVNMLSVVSTCRFPFLALVTMRGEWEERNEWQEPMGRATRTVLEAMGVTVLRAEEPGAVAGVVREALVAAFEREEAVAVLLAQRLVGRKDWGDGK